MNPLRRWWWRWRLRVWECRLHRGEAEYAARKDYGKGKFRWYDSRRVYVECEVLLRELDSEREHALFQINRFRNLLSELPPMRVLEGGKKDEASNG